MNLKNQIKQIIKNLKNDNEHFQYLQNKDFAKLCKTIPEIKTLLNKNHKWANAYTGKRCFILGNGPSLKEEQLEWLKDELVITVHQAAKADFFGQVHSNFHFWADPDFCSSDIDDELYRCMIDDRFKKYNTECFFPIQFKQFTMDKNLDKFINVNYYYPNVTLFENFDCEINFEKYVPGCHTVVHYAILFAIFLGCSEIILQGCECSVIISDIDYYLKGESSNNYSYTTTKAEKELKQNIRNKHSMEETFLSNYQIFKGYRILNTFCQNKNIKLWNATPGGLLDCVQRRKINEFKSTK